MYLCMFVCMDGWMDGCQVLKKRFETYPWGGTSGLSEQKDQSSKPRDSAPSSVQPHSQVRGSSNCAFHTTLSPWMGSRKALLKIKKSNKSAQYCVFPQTHLLESLAFKLQSTFSSWYTLNKIIISRGNWGRNFIEQTMMILFIIHQQGKKWNIRRDDSKGEGAKVTRASS